jgi:hypothetical protein
MSCTRTSLVCIPGVQKREGRLEENTEVQKYAPVFDVIKIVLNPLLDLLFGWRLIAIRCTPSESVGVTAANFEAVKLSSVRAARIPAS